MRKKKMNLPIDVIPNTVPPRFKWRQIIDTPVGKRTQEHEGVLPPSMEQAVLALVNIAKQLSKEVESLTAPPIRPVITALEVGVQSKPAVPSTNTKK